MDYTIKEINNNRQIVTMGIALILMSLGFLHGTMNRLLIVIYALGIKSLVQKILHKGEVIEISNRNFMFIKPKAEDVVLDLADLSKLSIRSEGNWAVRKDILELVTPDRTVNIIVSRFDINKLKSVLKEVCSEFQISNDIY